MKMRSGAVLSIDDDMDVTEYTFREAIRDKDIVHHQDYLEQEFRADLQKLDKKFPPKDGARSLAWLNAFRKQFKDTITPEQKDIVRQVFKPAVSDNVYVFPKRPGVMNDLSPDKLKTEISDFAGKGKKTDLR
jgi:hypothetical protein